MVYYLVGGSIFYSFLITYFLSCFAMLFVLFVLVDLKVFKLSVFQFHDRRLFPR